MKRRELLKHSLFLSAGGFAVSRFAGLVLGSTEESGSHFNATSQLLMRRISRIVIPETHSKGAVGTGSDVKALALINWCNEKVLFNEVQFLFDSIDESSNKTFGEPATTLAQSRLIELITKLDQGKLPFNPSLQRTFRSLKQLIVFCYCTSKEGATEELVYIPMPGGFTGSIPYASVGAAYSSKAIY